MKSIGQLVRPSLLALLALVVTYAHHPVSVAGEKRILEALSDSSYKVRLQAVILIGKRKMSHATVALRAILDDKHEAVRAAAMISIGKLGDQASRRPIALSLNHDSRLVAKAAERSLILLDKALGHPVYLVAIDRPSLPNHVARSRGNRLTRSLRKKLMQVESIVLSAGEENVLQGERLTSHLTKRKLTGILLQPKLTSLGAKVDGRDTTVSCKVGVLVSTLVRRRLEFSSGSEADASIEDTSIAEEDRVEMENQVIDASIDSAGQQVIEYLTRREP